MGVLCRNKYIKHVTEIVNSINDVTAYVLKCWFISNIDLIFIAMILQVEMGN